jgi:hypothetical protein
VFELRGTPRLAQESVDVFLVRHATGPRNLDRHDAIQFHVASLVDGPKGPDPNLFEQLKLPQLSPHGTEELRYACLDHIDAVVAVRTMDLHGFRSRAPPIVAITGNQSRAVRRGTNALLPGCVSVRCSTTPFGVCP